MLPDDIISTALEQGLTIACAESVTGGALCSSLVEVPGASSVMCGGIVSYTIDAKVNVLGVDRSLIDHAGVVSEEVALAMAHAARERFGADIGVATTGAAGPEPHGGRRPGTICVASVGLGEQMSATAKHSGDRASVRRDAITDAHAVLAYLLQDTSR